MTALTLEARQGTSVVPSGGFSQGVPLATVLNELSEFNSKFMYHADKATHDVVALWIASTYFMEKWMYHPRLYISSPQAGTGKSTQGSIIEALSLNGEKPSNVSSAYIWGRVNETEGKVTILIDESDNIWAKGKDTTDLQGILNDGFQYGAKVGRAQATDEGISTKRYDSYCPIGIIGIRNSRIPDTLMSRSIKMDMTLPPTGTELDWFDVFDHDDFIQHVHEELSKVDVPHRMKLESPSHLGMRSFRQVWLPLFVMAELAGGDWPERVYNASVALSGSGSKGELGNGTKVLLAVFDYFMDKDTDKATPSELADYINNRDDLWQTEAQRVSYYLKNYDLTSRASNGRKYFYREDVMETVKLWQSDYYNLRAGDTLSENPTLGTTGLHSEESPVEHYKAQAAATKQDMDDVLSKLDSNMDWN